MTSDEKVVIYEKALKQLASLTMSAPSEYRQIAAAALDDGELGSPGKDELPGLLMSLKKKRDALKYNMDVVTRMKHDLQEIQRLTHGVPAEAAAQDRVSRRVFEIAKKALEEELENDEANNLDANHIINRQLKMMTLLRQLREWIVELDKEFHIGDAAKLVISAIDKVHQ